jgi:hypothetical protein
MIAMRRKKSKEAMRLDKKAKEIFSETIQIT